MAQLKTGFPIIDLKDYIYDLPKERIAQYPVKDRDGSRLLVFKNGNVSHSNFRNITELIPEGSTLFFNDTKVIPARIMLQRNTGAWIEIFLLEPVSPVKEIAQAMLVNESCTWKCLVGNLKKWKNGEVLEYSFTYKNKEINVVAALISRSEMRVEFSWNAPMTTFSEILDKLGKIPLPPYITRDSEAMDTQRYQTIYSRNKGAVAAPTAGLHFTDDIINDLIEKNIKTNFLTLHVSAGTFQPIKTDNIEDHPMHLEQIVINRSNIQAMLDSTLRIAIGTTSMRTMESIYWYGVQLESKKSTEFEIKKETPYTLSNKLDFNNSLENILERMDELDVDKIHGTTEIFIVPGYKFKNCQGLITNFHMPGSTLILLVAAFIGNKWKTVYEEALTNEYRFLSYGDSSILFPDH